MPAANIKVFLRIRPSAMPSQGFSAQPEEGIVAFESHKDRDDAPQVSYTVDNARTLVHRFKFDGILGMQITQEQLFDVVAKPVIEDVLQGINGTIFAYGQTGSGKTFTITGGSEKYADRGLIPRSIAYLFQAFQRGGGSNFQLAVSYLEIYNNDGFDLLTDRDTHKLEDLPKVRLVEDEDGNMHLRNLAVIPVPSEEDALNHLFLGDTNRVVAETPMNDASTRSHCMFILWVQSTQAGSSNVRRAKLHLVDLAGSERISKTGVTGNLQKEAVNINLSLHFLGQVIESLHQRSRGGQAHIPYRNSLMTSVLRDSLGGNCKTVMVGTAAVETACIDESVSTCRFAQRVATIKNNAIINEELDPALLIKKLKKEADGLKEELKLLQGDEEGEVLAEADVSECKKLVSEYLEEADPEAPFVCGSGLRFRECFRILREIYWQQGVQDGVAGNQMLSAHSLEGGSQPVADTATSDLENAVLELRAQVEHRDQEIGMLVQSLKNRSKGKEAQNAVKNGPVFIKASGSRSGAPGQEEGGQTEEHASNASSSGPLNLNVGASASASSAAPAAPAASAGSALLDRNQAFDVFRKSVRRTETMEENKEMVLKLVEEAQGLGEKANAIRLAREQVKVRVEKARMERALESTPRDPDDMVPPQDSPEIVAMLQEMAEHKRIFTEHTERLRQVKADIQKFQRAQAENAQRLQRDFENWYATYAAQQGLQNTVSLETTQPSPDSRACAQRSSSLPASTSVPSASPSSRGSEVYSSARPTPEPVPPQQARQGALPRAASSDRPRPLADAGRPPQSSASAGSARSPGSTMPASEHRSPKPPSMPSAAPAASVSGTAPTTGDAETDQTIAAFYAAMSELGR